MPETLPTVSPLAVVVLMLMLMSIVGAWIWAILRLAFGLPVLPPNTPRIVPWGPGSVLAAMVFWVALQMAVPTAYFSAIRPRPADAVATGRPDLTPGEMMALSAVQNSLTLLLVPLVLAATSGARPRDFGVARRGLGNQVVRGDGRLPPAGPVRVLGDDGIGPVLGQERPTRSRRRSSTTSRREWWRSWSWPGSSSPPSPRS